MDDDEEKQNASYHVPKVVWRLIFGFLKVCFAKIKILIYIPIPPEFDIH